MSLGHLRWAAGAAVACVLVLVGAAGVGPACGFPTVGWPPNDASPHDPGVLEGADAGPPRPLTLIGPPAGTRWERESSHLITWDGPVPLPSITAVIATSFDAGQTWRLHDTIDANARRYVWTLPASGPSRGRLRVSIGSYVAETVDVELEPTTRRNYSWTRVQDAMPCQIRDGAGALVHQGRMWLIGGWNPAIFPRGSANDVWSSSNGVTWTLEKPNTYLDATFDRNRDFEGRHFAGYQVVGGKMWILGGDPVQGIYQTDVWSSVDGKAWTRVDRFPTETSTVYLPPTRDMPPFGLRSLHMTGALGGKLWILGGQTNDAWVHPLWPGVPWAVFNDVWTSDDGASWSRVEPRSPTWEPRGIVSDCPVYKGRMWVIGGGVYDNHPIVPEHPREFHADAWSTADGATWTKAAEPPPFSPRQYHNVAVFDDRLWVVGGYNPLGNQGDAWYTRDAVNWYRADPPPAYLARHAASVWVHGGAMYLGLGSAADAALKFVADMWRIAAE